MPIQRLGPVFKYELEELEYGRLPTADNSSINTDLAAWTGTNLVTSGLQMYFDASIPDSYARTGTTWNNLALGSTFSATATILGSFTFNAVPIASGQSSDPVNRRPSPSYFGNFESGSSRILINSPSTASVSSCTVQMFVYYNANQGEMSIFSYRTADDTNGVQVSAGFSAGTNQIHFRHGGGGARAETTLDLRTWNFVSGVMTPTTMSISKNGGSRITNTYGSVASFSPTQAWMVQRDPPGLLRDTLNGRLGLVLFYNRALSVTEELQNFNSLRTRFGI